MFKHLVVGALCAGLMACGATVPEAQQPEQQSHFGREAVSVAAMVANSSNGQVVVDMRNTGLGFRVEQGLDYSAITVIFPDSRVMNLEKWLPELAAELQTTPARLQEGFTLYPFMAPAAGTVTQFAPDCALHPDCSESYQRPDGSWVCICG